MKGYLNNPDATAAMIDGEGWLHTGDIGSVDADGYLYVLDRRDDLIVSGGENVYPAEVEAALLAHPAVDEAGVVGVPDPEWGRSVAAVVALNAGQRTNAEELIAFCRQRLAGYKVPRHVEFRESLPRNAGGKLLRREIRIER
jgi:acyl-CoA synthetase (AMP-forming)/AMP-acid ligase II